MRTTGNAWLKKARGAQGKASAPIAAPMHAAKAEGAIVRSIFPARQKSPNPSRRLLASLFCRDRSEWIDPSERKRRKR